MIGPQLFQGLISLQTKAGEFQDTFFRSHLYNSDLIRPETAKSYFFQQYNAGEGNSRIPDFRYQLYWDPAFNFEDSSTKKLAIYSSDIKGTFEVELNGFSQTGNPVSISRTFEVE